MKPWIIKGLAYFAAIIISGLLSELLWWALGLLKGDHVENAIKGTMIMLFMALYVSEMRENKL